MIQGSIVALVTPMTADNGLDWEALDKLVDWHIEQGTDSIVAVGTSGESATLNVDEHLKVIERVVRQAGGRVPIIAGTGANSTTEAIELTQAAKSAGADACLSVTPYYNKPTQEGLFLHHQAIARDGGLPQILYNVPGRTGVDMLPETVVRLSEIDGIIGIKEATGDIERARWLIERVSEDFLVMSGDDITAVELILAGGKGNISVTANVAPKLMSDLCQLALDGKTDEARALNDRLMPLHQALFLESNPIPVKWAAEQLGLIGSGIRLPLTYLADDCQAPVRSAMEAVGLL